MLLLRIGFEILIPLAAKTKIKTVYLCLGKTVLSVFYSILERLEVFHFQSDIAPRIPIMTSPGRFA